jgi:hypothetical protein
MCLAGFRPSVRYSSCWRLITRPNRYPSFTAVACQPAQHSAVRHSGTFAFSSLPQLVSWHEQMLQTSLERHGSGHLSRYSDWLRAGRFGDRIPVGGEIFRTCPDRPWGPPRFLYNGGLIPSYFPTKNQHAFMFKPYLPHAPSIACKLINSNSNMENLLW